MHHKFHDDLDIFAISQSVIAELDKIQQNKTSVIQEFERLKIIAEKSCNPTDKAKATELLHYKGRTIQFIKNDTLVSRYKEDIQPIVKIYNSLQSSSCIFGIDTCTNIPKRVYTIISFLNTTNNYIPITWDCTYNLSKICPKCYGYLKKRSNIMRCDSCSYSFVIVPMPTVPIVGSHIRTESTYLAKKNFIKEYKHIYGLLHSITPEQKRDTDNYIYKIQEPNPTRETIRNAIKQCGYNNYNDTNYLFHLVTGAPLPSIDSYLDACADRFDKYYFVFTNVEKEGKNITNIHFLIRLFLYQEGVPFEEEWFSSLSDSTLNKHRRNAKKICFLLQEQFPEENWAFPHEWKE